MQLRNYKVYSQGIYEIITADSVHYLPNTGQTCFFLNGEMLHVAPANVMVTNTNEVDKIIYKHRCLFNVIEDVLGFLVSKRHELSTIKQTEETKKIAEIYSLSINCLNSVQESLVKEE